REYQGEAGFAHTGVDLVHPPTSRHSSTPTKSRYGARKEGGFGTTWRGRSSRRAVGRRPRGRAPDAGAVGARQPLTPSACLSPRAGVELRGNGLAEVANHCTRRAPMRSADEALSREVERGMTREHLLRRAAALGIVVAGGAFGPLTEAAFAETLIKRGGTFRLGITGGGSTDFIDGQHIVAKTDIARLVTGWESLARFNQRYHILMDGLAQEIVAQKANRWVIRLRKGIEFHNGKTVTADDVMYSFRRTLTKSLGLFGYGGLSSINPRGMKKLDKYTVRLNLLRPDANLLDNLS